MIDGSKSRPREHGASAANPAARRTVDRSDDNDGSTRSTNSRGSLPAEFPPARNTPLPVALCVLGRERMQFSQRNESDAERTIRVALGLILLLLTFLGPRTPWGWLGVVPLLTGIFGSCPVYALLQRHR